NGSAFLVAMLAAARIGATVIPVSTLATARELREQLGHADVEILLSAASYRAHDYRQRLAEVGDLPLLRHVLIDTEPTELADAALLAALEDDVEPTDVLAIIYTSGSTSAPKGVVHTHA
ncbi:long-chain fatty acid--CoA ligase, partial [Mycolicibacterium fallax]